MQINLYDFYEDLKTKNMLFCYSGPIAQTSIEGVSQTLRRNLEYEDAGNSAAQAVFSIFIEQVQNILNYSAEKLDDDRESDSELRVGIVAIGHEDDHNYFIYCGNRVYNRDIDPLRDRIESIRHLNKDQLKVLYKERRRMDPEPGSKGAGLGLIEIARKAGKPLEYSFTNIDDEFSFFSTKVVVGR
ncbi:SiaB family protein kinase [Candidatus Formimonas warabiya]|uniref:Uncharacterized protein n=1 Tax=Formimonas warabiya TaxID=1761012 RepID=A0A3G1KQB3_FORW1|nr:SiaB family protein kinase [Candidatus Formimonas warabiya]ATW24662.1 hypothetical protein DCMF_07615 [Candidatus Formimonas warabiya]